MSVQVHRGGGKPGSRRGCRICKFAFSIEIPQSLAGGTQWRMTSSAGCSEPPCRPTSSRGLHGLNQHASIGFCAYLLNHDFSRRIRSIDSSVAAPRAFSPTSTSTPKPPQQNITFFSSLHPPRDNSVHTQTHSHNASSTIRRPRSFAPHRPFARPGRADFPAADPTCDFLCRARHPDPSPAGTYLPGPRPVRPDGFHSCVCLTSEPAITFHYMYMKEAGISDTPAVRPLGNGRKTYVDFPTEEPAAN